MPVLSGVVNAGAPFEVRADRPAADSAYAALVRLVETQADRFGCEAHCSGGTHVDMHYGKGTAVGTEQPAQ